MSSLGEPPRIVGIVNVTPDSFSDGGRFTDVAAAAAHARLLVDEGADIVDIGGESTRPGAAPVSVETELARVVPVVERVCEECPNAVVSIDTRKPAVARAAVDAGARILNDVSGFVDHEMRALAVDRELTCVVMHMRGTPQTMQEDTGYDDVVADVHGWLLHAATALEHAGVPRHRIVLDPGLGFGKALVDNPKLIAATPVLRAHGYQVLLGASRKRFVGVLSGVDQADARLAGSIGAALAGAYGGADYLRVHDVAETRRALAVFWPSRPKAA